MSRSSRRDIFEKVVLSLFLMRRFRCLECKERHYNFVHSRRDGTRSKCAKDLSAIENLIEIGIDLAPAAGRCLLGPGYAPEQVRAAVAASRLQAEGMEISELPEK